MSRASARPSRSAVAPGPELAFEIATRFLGVRPRSEWEVEQRLLRAKASPEVIGVTLGRLRELDLISDIAFARWWLEQRDRHAPRGRRLVEAELRQHRVPPDVIHQLRDELAANEIAGLFEGDGEGSALTEEQRAEQALRQHLRGRPLPADPKAVQRIGMYLVRRGFDTETVRAALRSSRGDASLSDQGRQ